jgi:hypothetical protein
LSGLGQALNFSGKHSAFKYFREMWWEDQTFNKQILDRDQNAWSFRVWHDFVDKIYVQRIFFWDAKKEITGLVEFKDHQTLHIKRLRDRMIKLAKEKSYRDIYVCDIKFPVEKYY